MTILPCSCSVGTCAYPRRDRDDDVTRPGRLGRGCRSGVRTQIVHEVDKGSGPLLLLSATSWPAATASRATAVPMFPLPMNPQVVTVTSTPPVSYTHLRAHE